MNILNCIFRLVSLAFLMMMGCKNNANDSNQLLMKVGDHLLYEKDLPSFIKEAQKDKDGKMKAYILNWTKNQLLLQKSLLNISEQQQKNIEKLVEKYREDLLIDTYKNALVHEKMDTTVTGQAIKAYHEKHKDILVLNKPIVKYRMLKLSLKESKHKKWFRLWKKSEQDAPTKRMLDSLSKIPTSEVQINQEGFWVRYDYMLRQIPPMKKYTAKKIQRFKKPKILTLRDDKNVYYVELNNYLPEGNTAPIRYIHKTVEKIILNERAKRLIDQLEREILEDAQKKNLKIHANNA